MSDTSTDIMELFSETSDDNVIEVLNSQVYELEQKVEYYKNKSHQLGMQLFKNWVEIEQQKKRIDNLKSILISNLPPYLNAIVECL